MILFEKGGIDYQFTDQEIIEALSTAAEKLGKKQNVLILPPDFTRFHSQAGFITELLYKYYRNSIKDILPAIGTHKPMSKSEIAKMFGSVPLDLFRDHKWKEDLTTLGIVPREFINEVSGGLLNFEWPAQVNKIVADSKYDLIFSVGQVVPHEVVGMANYNKNIFVGTGGRDGINKSHYLGAVYGMEKIMGRADTPVRKVLNYASDHFAKGLPIIYIQTVIGRNENGKLVIRGLYIGDDFECFQKASDLSLKVNFEMVHKPLKKVVVFLDPDEFKSTWLGNKSVYRTRMAIEDGGELVVLAPGLKEFGEDEKIDELIRKYGYKTTPEILEFVARNDELKENLSAAAHLIHGSSENRFKITYCPKFLTKTEIESVGYNYADYGEISEKYDPSKLLDGFNTLTDGEEIFYISNPALGLWAHEDRFQDKR